MLKQWRSSLLALPLFAFILVGCTDHRYRTYDPYNHDYHTWGAAEGPHYDVWITETHHNHVDYEHLNKHDREDYWRWRHDHN